MSSITGVSLNAVYPSGLVDRPGQPVVPTPRQDSPLFTSVVQSEATERSQNRRELDPDERRQDNQRGRPLTPSSSPSEDSDRPQEEAGQLLTREALEAAQRRGELDLEQRAKLEEIQQLAERDREVRSHEEAHRAVAGRYAGPISYDFVQGPDGRRYAVSGEVPIDLSPAATPEQTAAKMEQVRRAALAPAEPSPADRQIASQAMQLMLEARQEAVRLRTSEGDRTDDSVEPRVAQSSQDSSDELAMDESTREEEPQAAFASLETGDQDRATDDADRDEALDERNAAVNTESLARLSELQATIAEILRNQGASLDDINPGRNVNFQI